MIDCYLQMLQLSVRSSEKHTMELLIPATNKMRQNELCFLLFLVFMESGKCKVDVLTRIITTGKNHFSSILLVYPVSFIIELLPSHINTPE